MCEQFSKFICCHAIQRLIRSTHTVTLPAIWRCEGPLPEAHSKPPSSPAECPLMPALACVCGLGCPPAALVCFDYCFRRFSHGRRMFWWQPTAAVGHTGKVCFYVYCQLLQSHRYLHIDQQSEHIFVGPSTHTHTCILSPCACSRRPS